MRRVVGAVVGVVLLVAVGCVPMPPDPDPVLCPEGTFSATGAAPCTPAPPGTFVDAVGATGATECAPGFFQDEAGQVSCKVAPAGSFVATAGAAQAVLCPLGRFQTNVGAVSCLIAPIGTFVDTTGATSATACPVGLTTLATGSTSASDCMTPAIIAVAYTNVDGIDGYDPNGTDVLIAKLVDLNGDSQASIGDMVITNQYPTSIDASSFGNFTVTNHVAVGQAGGSTTSRFAVDASGNSYSWGTGSSESYQETVPNPAIAKVNIVDAPNFKSISVDPAAPSAPDTAASDFATPVDPSDDPFIDVDILL